MKRREFLKKSMICGAALGAGAIAARQLSSVLDAMQTTPSADERYPLSMIKSASELFAYVRANPTGRKLLKAFDFLTDDENHLLSEANYYLSDSKRLCNPSASDYQYSRFAAHCQKLINFYRTKEKQPNRFDGHGVFFDFDADRFPQDVMPLTAEESLESIVDCQCFGEGRYDALILVHVSELVAGSFGDIRQRILSIIPQHPTLRYSNPIIHVNQTDYRDPINQTGALFFVHCYGINGFRCATVGTGYDELYKTLININALL